MQGEIPAQVPRWTTSLNGYLPQTAEVAFDLKLDQIKAKIQTFKAKAALKILGIKTNWMLKTLQCCIQWRLCPDWIWEEISRGRFTSTDLVPSLLGFPLERKSFKYCCLAWQKMVDLWIQFLRHEIQYVDEIMYFLVDVRFRAISELRSNSVTVMP